MACPRDRKVNLRGNFGILCTNISKLLKCHLRIHFRFPYSKIFICSLVGASFICKWLGNVIVVIIVSLWVFAFLKSSYSVILFHVFHILFWLWRFFFVIIGITIKSLRCGSRRFYSFLSLSAAVCQSTTLKELFSTRNLNPKQWQPRSQDHSLLSWRRGWLNATDTSR